MKGPPGKPVPAVPPLAGPPPLCVAPFTLDSRLLFPAGSSCSPGAPGGLGGSFTLCATPSTGSVPRKLSSGRSDQERMVRKQAAALRGARVLGRVPACQDAAAGVPARLGKGFPACRKTGDFCTQQSVLFSSQTSPQLLLPESCFFCCEFLYIFSTEDGPRDSG